MRSPELVIERLAPNGVDLLYLDQAPIGALARGDRGRRNDRKLRSVRPRIVDVFHGSSPAVARITRSEKLRLALTTTGATPSAPFCPARSERLTGARFPAVRPMFANHSPRQRPSTQDSARSN